MATPLTRRALLGSSIGLAATLRARAATPRRPNIVFIYADDLGYGDVGCYGATAVKTPNIDRAARAKACASPTAHSTSATCTPSRYALLTGEYAWRKNGHRHPARRRRADHRARPHDACRHAQAGRLPHRRRRQVAPRPRAAGNVDWNGEIKPGPLEIGFD